MNVVDTPRPDLGPVVKKPPLATVPHAGFWRRCAAGAIDYGIISAAIMPIRLLMGGLVGWFAEVVDWGEIGLLGQLLLSIVLVLICWCGYFVLLESSREQASFGKHIVGLKVADADGQRLSAQGALGRFFAMLVFIPWFGFGFISQLFNARRQALHDRVSKTMVYQDGQVINPAVVVIINIIAGGWLALTTVFVLFVVEYFRSGGSH